MEDLDLERIVARLRRQGSDDAEVEVKAAGSGLGSAVWKSVSAFANTAGGLIILGLDESSSFAPVAGFDPQKIMDAVADGFGDGNVTGGRLTNPPNYRPWRDEVDGAPVVLVSVEENAPGTKPCFITTRGPGTGAFRRLDDKDVQLSPTEIFELEHQLSAHQADRESVVEARLSDLEDDRIQALIDAHTKRGSRAVLPDGTYEQHLQRLNITDGSGQVRLAGLLTTGHYPQQFCPRLFIDVTTHPGTEKSDPTAARRFVDRVTCDGPLGAMVDTAIDAVSRNLRTHSVIVGAGREDRLEIPRGVLREAITNAVIHREYHPLFTREPVTVDIHPDRVVISNPGGLWGGKTEDTLADGRSACRNATLMQIASVVPISAEVGSVAEGQGGGVAFIQHTLRTQNLRPPEYTTDLDRVRLTLYRHGRHYTDQDAWMREAAGRDVTPQEHAVLSAIRNEGGITVEEAKVQLGADSDDIRELFARLVDEEICCVGDEGALVLHRTDGGPANAKAKMTEDVSQAPHDADAGVLALLSSEEVLSARELAERDGRSLESLRPVLRRLVRGGRLVATAPPTSKNRRYRLPD